MNLPVQMKTGFVVLLIAAGCSAPPQKTETAAVPKKPESTMQVASLNLSGFNKLFEKKQIDQFARLLKKEQVDILAVQGITRYPGIKRHIDFVDELVSHSEMQQVFGEMYTNAGRQSGNGIFSVYSLRNNHNDPFDGVKSAQFEAALATSVDRGIKDVVIVSALLPPKAPEADQSKCVKIILDKSNAGTNLPLVIAGNLPASPAIRESGHLQEAGDPNGSAGNKHLTTRIWYVDDGSLAVMGTRTVETDFGPMLVAQFGLFR
ncbi:MAG TPA: endonuclease/exonuclease/phosphatase family protein [Bacteroidota bacterium]|nr:endonuclease/exonuclease/phosphatase family protein [Bacteroidota bacterium]